MAFEAQKSMRQQAAGMAACPAIKLPEPHNTIFK